MHRKCLRLQLVLMGFACLVLLVSLLPPLLTATVSDGEYDLNVTISSARESEITRIACEWTHGNTSQELLHDLPEPEGHFSATADPYLGQPLKVRIPWSEHVYLLGWAKKDFQGRDLYIVADFDNGERKGLVVPIPHRAASRAVSVTLP